MISSGGGIGLLVLAVIVVFYSENWLLRFFLAAIILIWVGVQAFFAFEVNGSPQRFYWSLGVTGFVVACVAISKIKPHRDPPSG